MMRVVVLASLLAMAAVVSGHGVLTSPVPRSTMRRTTANNFDGTKIVGPFVDAGAGYCGGSSNLDTGPELLLPENVFGVGDRITIAWNPTIPHSPNTPAVTVAIQYSPTDSFGAQGNTLVANAASGTTPVTRSVQLPANKLCQSCIVRFVWNAFAADGGHYIGCADIQIVAQADVASARARAQLAQDQRNNGGGGDGSGSDGTAGAVVGTIFGIVMVVGVGAGGAWFYYRRKGTSGYTVRSSVSRPGRGASMGRKNVPYSANAATSSTANTTATTAEAPHIAVISMGPLPEGWQEFKTDEGIPYYYQPSTGVTVWERPAPNSPVR